MIQLIGMAIDFTGRNFPPPVVNERTEHSFKCLEFIIYNAIDKLDIANIEAILKLIFQLVSMKNNLTISLDTINFILNLADFLAKRKMGSPNSKFDKIWIRMFDEIRVIGTDPRGDVRNLSYQILEHIISNNGKSISKRVLLYIFTTLMEQLLDFAHENYFHYSKLEIDPSIDDTQNNKYKEDQKLWERSIIILNKTFANNLFIASSILKEDNR